MKINSETEMLQKTTGIKKQIKFLLVYKAFEVHTFYVDLTQCPI
jgi:hypothetical protein